VHLKKIACLTGALGLIETRPLQRAHFNFIDEVHTAALVLRALPWQRKIFALGRATGVPLWVHPYGGRERILTPLGLDKVSEDRFFAQCLASLKPMQTVHEDEALAVTPD